MGAHAAGLTPSVRFAGGLQLMGATLSVAAR